MTDLGDVGSFHSHSILNAITQQVDHVRPAFNNDDGIRFQDIRTGQGLSRRRLSDLLNPEGLADIVKQFVAVDRPVIKPFDQDLLCTFNNLLSLADPDVLDRSSLNVRYAGAHAVDGLK